MYYYHCRIKPFDIVQWSSIRRLLLDLDIIIYSGGRIRISSDVHKSFIQRYYLNTIEMRRKYESRLMQYYITCPPGHVVTPLLNKLLLSNLKITPKGSTIFNSLYDAFREVFLSFEGFSFLYSQW